MVSEINVEPWGAVENLLLASGSSPEQLKAAILEIGLEHTMDVVVGELAVRFTPYPMEAACRYQLEVTCDAERVGRVLTINSDGIVAAQNGWADNPLPRIRLDAVDLVDGLFGPFERRRHHTRQVKCLDVWLNEQTSQDSADLRAMLLAAQRANSTTASATHALISACLGQPVDLGQLSARFGSDKWAGFHWYMQHYEHHFERFRNAPVRLLEIGVGGYQFEDLGGESLWIWQRYFRRGLVYGLDVFEKSGIRGPRVRTVQGDQSDPHFLGELGRQLGPFDIVIDDGSHVNEHVRTSFQALFPYLRNGGLYIVEDLQTAYWPSFGGDNRDLANATTSIGMLKGLVDGLNHKDIPRGSDSPSFYTDRHVVGLHFYPNVAIVEKGVNAEESIPAIVKERYLEMP